MKVELYNTKLHKVVYCFSKDVSISDITNFEKTLEKQNLSSICIRRNANELGDSAFSYDLLITDVQELCLNAKNQNRAFLFYLHKGNKNESIEGIPYAIEDLTQIDEDYLIKIYQRAKDIPWTILETDRLVLREQTEADIDALYEIYKDPEISRFTDNLYEDKEKELSYLREYKKQLYEFCGMGIWALVRKSDYELIGRAGLAFRDGYDTPEIGYVIGTPFQRQGYGYEACEAILQYSFAELGFEEMRVLLHKDNNISKKLSEKLGFQYTHNSIIDGVEMENYINKKE